MKVKDFSILLVVTTLCVTWVVWGSIYVARTVEDKNYHPPTVQEEITEAYQSCTAAMGTESEDCRKLVELK